MTTPVERKEGSIPKKEAALVSVFGMLYHNWQVPSERSIVVAQLKITYDKRFNAFDGYMMETQVDSVYAEPTILQKCLVVQKAGVTEETLLRVADVSELESLSELPGTSDVFESSVLDSVGVQVGDEIHLEEELPALWDVYFPSVVVGQVYEVSDVSELAFNRVKVTTSFPCPAQNVVFSIWREGSQLYPTGVLANPSDGAADRDYASFPGETEFLAATHYDTFDTYDAANNKFSALESQAQALVDALNQDSYTEIYEGEYT